jgi:DNA-binding MarR family transcriptional regulator
LAPKELRAWIAFMRAGLALTRAMDRDAETTGRLLFSEHHILATLNLGPPGGIRPTDLAEQTALTKSGLTRAIDRLESQRLIERRACPTDARGQLIVLTAEGKRNLRRSAPEHFRSIARNFADHLTDREVEVLTTALERVAAADVRR